MKQANVREAALKVLRQIDEDGAYSQIALHHMIEEQHNDDRDKALLTKLVYGTIQYQNTLTYYLQPFLKKQPENWVLLLLQMSVYQLMYLDRIPSHAVIHEAVNMAKRRGHRGISGMVNGVLRSFQRKGPAPISDVTNDLQRLALETSHPEWLLTYWLQELDETIVRQMCQANLETPAVTVRINKQKTNFSSLKRQLATEGVTVEPGRLSPDAAVVSKGVIQHTSCFQNGEVTIQDESAMLPVYALNLQGHMNVLDSCAAPGGKTTHIAEQMRDTGDIVATDIYDHKIKLVQNQAERLGLRQIKARVLDSREASSHFSSASFDRILADVPCSGLGVLRHKPELKWRQTKAQITQLAQLQYDLLRALAPLLKKQGYLVYSTCTVSYQENEAVIEKFLNQHPEYELDQTVETALPVSLNHTSQVEQGYVKILPQDAQTDGFFIARLKKRY